MRNPVARASVAMLILASVTACQQEAPAVVAPPAPAVTASPFKLTAGIQDIMTLMIDPSADALWESVSTTVTKDGVREYQPRTDTDWGKAHTQALMLIEGSNLLMMEGRQVAREGVQKLEDHGTPGNLSAEESQQAISADRQTFIAFATGLNDVGRELLHAIEARDTAAIMDAGAAMDEVCEGCHLKFWYPGQKIPRFPNEAPEEYVMSEAQLKAQQAK